MNKLIFLRPFSTGVVTFTLSTALTSVVAMAACGGAPTLVALGGLVGPPSITATEASTDQALELIRRRREEAGGTCPAGFTRSGGNCVPTGAAQQFSAPTPVVAQAAPAPAAAPQAQVTTTTTTGPAPKAAPQAKRPAAAQQVAQSAPAASAPTATRSAAASQAAPAYSYSGGSLKDGGYDVPMAGTVRTRGVWVEGYYDHEKHDNLNPGQQANPTRRMTSGGVISGVDVSEYSTGSILRGYQFGFFGGHNSTRSKFTDTVGNKVQDNGTLEQTATTGARQEIEGAFFGVYGSMAHGAFSADVAFKIDAFDMSQQFTDTLINCGRVVNRFDQTAMTNYIVASNANYRFNLSNNHYIEPTVGLRYTMTDFGGNAPALGVRDGEAFRVQGGLRFGMRHVMPDGWIWQTSLTGLLYSDVSLSGFVLNNVSGLLPSTPLVDEGKLRAMGILETRVNVGYGYTLYGDVEVRGGDDVIGFGSRVGVRYQW